MTVWVVLVSLAAAASFGWSTAAMHFDASAPHGKVGTVALVGHLVRQWRWLTGMAASLTGLALHALALRLGSLAVVQPIVVSGLVFSLVFRAALEKRLLPRTVTLWAGVTVAGMAVFLIATSSTSGSGDASGRGAAVMVVLGVAASCVCWRVASSLPIGNQALLRGTAVGINVGLTAGTLKATSGSGSLQELFTTWPLYVLIGLGVGGFIANQVLYSRGPLTSSLPMLSVANPLVALVYGAVAFGERPARHLALVLLEVVGLAAVLLGVFFMAREGEATIEEQAAVSV